MIHEFLFRRLGYQPFTIQIEVSLDAENQPVVGSITTFDQHDNEVPLDQHPKDFQEEIILEAQNDADLLWEDLVEAAREAHEDRLYEASRA